MESFKQILDKINDYNEQSVEIMDSLMVENVKENKKKKAIVKNV